MKSASKWFLAGLAVISAGTMTACGDSEGRFSVSFVWPDGAPDQGSEVWIHARVEERPAGRDIAGPIIASATPVRWGPNASVPLDSVPNGDARVVIVEVRDGPDRDSSEVLYFGLSAPFSLAAGDDKTVEVSLALRDAPGFQEGMAVEVLDLVDGRVSSPMIRIAVRTERANFIEIAQDPAFTFAYDSFDDPPASGEANGTAEYVLEYDLNEGLDCAQTPERCADSTRQIFVRVSTDQGYESAPQRVSVTLDTTGPVIQDVQFSPQAARRGQRVLLTFVSDEPLAETAASAVLQWASVDPGFMFVGRSGLQYQYALTVTPTVAEGEYALRGLVVRDARGVESSPVLDPQPTLIVDARAPVVSDIAVAPVRAAESSTVTVTFTVDEPIPMDQLSVTVGGQDATCDRTGSTTAPFSAACTFFIPAGQTAGETVETVSISVADAAGNLTNGSASVVFDFLPPDLVPGAFSLLLIPGANNLVGAGIQAIGRTATAQMQFAATEPLSAAPVVTAIPPSGSAVTPTLQSEAGLAYTYAYTAPAAGAVDEGRHQVQIALTDLAGNTSVLTPAALEFTVDVTAPDAPDVITPDRIVFTRQPWGPAGAASNPVFSLVGEAGAVAPGSLVRVTRAFFGEVIRTTADATGAFSIPAFPTTDTPDIAVQAIDEAGNASPEVLVRDGRWFGSLGGKRPGRIAPNPHRVARVPEVGPALVQNDLELSETEYQQVSGSGAPLTAAAAQRWENIDIPFNFTKRALMAFTYDPQRGRIVMFGGFGGVNRSDTLEWDGIRWTDVTPALPGPSPRRGAAMAYDNVRGVAVMYGGSDGNTYLGDTWEWDGSLWTRVTTTNAPPPLAFHAMTYDPDRRVIVLNGGQQQGGAASDQTWEYDGTWRQVTTTCTPAPCPFSFAELGLTMAYDPINQEMVRFGGAESFFGNQPYTWRYDGATATWTWADTSGPGAPTARIGPRIVHYPAGSGRPARMFMFGGVRFFDPSGEYRNEVYEWDGSAWTQVSPLADATGRFDHGMVYFPPTDEIVSFGGEFTFDFVTFLPDYDSLTWTYSGNRWSLGTQTTRPATRNGMVMTGHPDGTGIFMFAGEERFEFGTKFADAWLFNGRAWSPLAAPPVPGRSGAGFTLDSTRNRILIFGGEGDGQALLNDLVAYDANGNWSTISTSGTPPSPRLEAAMAYDPVGDRVYLFGGRTTGFSNETFVLNPGTGVWSAGPTGGPSARRGASMVYDPINQNIVLFGGFDGTTTFFDTWILDPATQRWTDLQLTTAQSPGARTWSRLVYDPDRQKVVLNGGNATGDPGSGTSLDDTWEWDGTTWREVARAARPPPKEYHGLTYGGTPAAVISFAGRGSVADVWRKRVATDQRPGAVATFDWSNAQVARDEILEVHFSVVTAGTGGARVDFWDPVQGVWSPLAANMASPSAPAALTGTLTSSAARDAVTGAGGLNFRISSVTPLGTLMTPPEVAFDNVGVEVRYRRAP